MRNMRMTKNHFVLGANQKYQRILLQLLMNIKIKNRVHYVLINIIAKRKQGAKVKDE